MDLKRLKLKKSFEEIIKQNCDVKTFYKGSINLEEIVAIISFPSQSFEVFAQSGPKIYTSELDIKVNVLGHKVDEVEAIAEQINRHLLKSYSSLDLVSINSSSSFEGDTRINGVQLSYEFKTHIEQEQ